MTDEIDYKALRASVKRYGRRPLALLPSDVADARRREQQWRRATARTRALAALSHLHPDDYSVLLDAAAAEVNDERGPLPGDDITNKKATQ